MPDLMDQTESELSAQVRDTEAPDKSVNERDLEPVEICQIESELQVYVIVPEAPSVSVNESVFEPDVITQVSVEEL